MAEERRSRLDLKIARDRVTSNLGPLWDQLCADVNVTCAKLKAVYPVNPAVRINPQNSVIEVSNTETSGGETERVTECILELRLDRNHKKLIAQVIKRDSRGRDLQAGADQPRSYDIVAEKLNDSLRFFNGQTLLPVDVVEQEIVENLLHMDLDS